jgi:hypothetical protein
MLVDFRTHASPPLFVDILRVNVAASAVLQTLLQEVDAVLGEVKLMCGVHGIDLRTRVRRSLLAPRRYLSWHLADVLTR